MQCSLKYTYYNDRDNGHGLWTIIIYNDKFCVNRTDCVNVIIVEC